MMDRPDRYLISLMLCMSGLVPAVTLAQAAPASKDQEPKAEVQTFNIEKTPAAAICAEQTSVKAKRLCEEMCRAWPADQQCLLTLRFGEPGVIFVQKHKPGKFLDVEALALADGFEPGEARKLRWYLTLHMGYLDLKDPTRSKKLVSPAASQQVIASMNKEAKTVNDQLAMLEETIRLADRVYGAQDVTLLRIVQATFQFAQLSGETKRAAELIVRAQELSERHLPEDHPYRAEIELRRGDFLIDVGQREQGLELLRSGYSRLDALYEGYHDTGLLATTKLARAYLRAGSPELAKPLLLKNARRQLILYGPRSKQSAQAYIELGGLYAYLDDTLNAGLAYGNAIKILGELKLDDDLSSYRVYAELGRMELKRATIAQAQAKKARRDGEEDEAQEHDERAQESLGLGQVLLDKALTIFKRDAPVAKDSPMAAGLIHELGIIHALNGEHELALAKHKEGFELRLKSYGMSHPQTFDSMRMITEQYAKMGRLEEALQMSRKVLVLVEQARGDQSGSLANAYEQVAKLAMRTGQLEIARAHQEKALKTRIGNYSPRLNIDMDQTSVMFKLARNRPTIDLALTLLEGKDDAAKLWEMMLDWQGMVTRSSMYRQQEKRVRAKLPRELEPDYAQWRFGYFGAKQTSDPKIEAKLAQAMPEFKRFLTQPEVTPTRLCQELKRRDATLISYHAFDRILVKDKELINNVNYMAFVISGKDCQVTRVELGTRDEIEALVQAYRDGVKSVERCYGAKGQAALCARELIQMDEQGKTLRLKIWDPLSQAIGKAQRLFVIPDGRLVEVSFDGLPDAQGKYLVEHHTISNLPFASALLYTPERVDGEGYFFAGDIDYGAQAEPMAALGAWQRCAKGRCDALKGQPAKTLVAQAQSLRAATTSSTNPCGQDIKWSALTTEVVPIAKQLSKLSREEIMLATGDAATEPLVRLAMPDRRVIHLATHGFYAQDKACHKYALRQALRPSLEQGSGKELDASGILDGEPSIDVARLTATVLAGANISAGQDSSQDGLMDGNEVASQDLSAAQLVVLSACETGRGIQAEGEGVMGLAQGYILAGAHEVIASLWQIPSGPTTTLFNDFYDAMYDKRAPKTPVEALRAAKLEAIKVARASGLSSSAFLWAAFVPILARFVDEGSAKTP